MRRLLAILIMLVSLSAQAEMAIVVSRDSPVGQLDKREVANIFLAKTNRINGGHRIQPLELNDENAKAIFYQRITGKSLPQINSYWTTLIFTGKGHPPKSFETIKRVLDILKTDPYAITYLPIDQVDDSMKVVHTFR